MTSAVVGYISRVGLKQAIGGSRVIHDDDYDRAIAAATSTIDRWTGRRFIRDTVASTRTFRVHSCDRVCVGDYTDPAQVVVETYDHRAGTWSTWDSDEWQAEADNRGNGVFVRLDGEPWRWIGTTGARKFPVHHRLGLLRATTLWNWDAIPWPVTQACLGLSLMNFRPQDRAAEMFDRDPVQTAKDQLMDYAVEGGTIFCRPMVG